MASTRIPSLVVHIGAGKAGSTAIQEALRVNAGTLLSRGILVPDINLEANGSITGTHITFFEQLQPLDEGAVAHVTSKLIALREHMDRMRASVAIISAENLINDGAFARLFAPSTLTFRIQVVIYIRRQDEYIQAMWSQWDSKVCDVPFKEWVDRTLPVMSGYYWEDILTNWHTSAPALPMAVRIFHPSRLLDSNVVSDFFQAIGVSPTDLVITSDRINATLNELGTWISWRNRRLYTDSDDVRFSDFLKHAGGLPVTRRLSLATGWTADERRSIVHSFTGANERVRLRYFPSLLEGELFPPVADDDEPPLTASEARAVELGILGSAVASLMTEAELDLVWEAVFRASSLR